MQMRKLKFEVGAGGGIVSMAVTYPLITVGTKMQIQSRSHTSFAGTVRRVVKQEGIIGLYGGLSSALFGIALTNGVYYYFYELSK